MLVQTMGGKVEGIQLICQYNIVAFQAFLLLENACFKNGLRESEPREESVIGFTLMHITVIAT